MRQRRCSAYVTMSLSMHANRNKANRMGIVNHFRRGYNRRRFHDNLSRNHNRMTNVTHGHASRLAGGGGNKHQAERDHGKRRNFQKPHMLTLSQGRKQKPKNIEAAKQ